MRVFLQRFSNEQKRRTPLGISGTAMALLTAYDWPGNIRQLENAMFRAVVLAEGPELTESDFPQIAAQVPGYLAPLTQPGRLELAPALSEQEVATFREAEAGDTRPQMRQPVAAIASTGPAGEVRKLAEVEEELIRFALKFYRGQMSEVARKLGIGRSTLYRKLKDYGIDPDDPLASAA